MVKKKLLFILTPIVVILLLLGGLAAFGYVTAKSFQPDIQAIQQTGSKLAADFQGQDLGAAKTEVQILSSQVNSLDSKYQKVAWAGAVPFFGSYVKDGQHAINAGKPLVKAVDTLIASVIPYADLLGFKTGEATPSGQTPKAQSIEDRIVFMAQTLDKISPDLDKVALDMEAAQKELDQINPTRYPETFAGKNIRSKIVELKSTVSESAQLLSQAKPLIKLLPELLGNPNAKTYMVLFQNDAELRPTGGFMTAYAFMRVTKGKIEPLASYDIYDLDSRFNKKVPAPDAIKKYLNETYLNLRNSNMSPDYKVSMDLFYKYYRDIPGLPKPDGIIAIDTHFPVEILKIIGPIGVGGWGNFSPQNDPHCDCPQVVYALEEISDRPVAGVKAGRKAALDAIKQKHLLFYFLEDKTQKVAEDFNAAGRIKPYAYDYLHINDANLGGAKTDMFITREVEQDIEKTNNTVTKTVSITYKNPRKGSNCNLEAGQLCLNGVYRDYIRLFVPKGAKLLSVVGSEVKEQVSEDLDKTVFEAFFTMRPESQSKIVFKYELPALDLSTYRLLIQKQAGLPSVKHTIILNGNQTIVDLNEDKELTLN